MKKYIFKNKEYKKSERIETLIVGKFKINPKVDIETLQISAGSSTVEPYQHYKYSFILSDGQYDIQTLFSLLELHDYEDGDIPILLLEYRFLSMQDYLLNKPYRIHLKATRYGNKLKVNTLEIFHNSEEFNALSKQTMHGIRRMEEKLKGGN